MGIGFSQLAAILFAPSNIVVVLGFIGVFLCFTPFWRTGRRIAALSSVAVAICAFSPLGTWLSQPLELRFPKYADDGQPVAGVVVLGGALDPNLSEYWGQPAVNNAGERTIFLAHLSRTYPSARIIFTGNGSPPEAAMIERFAPELGLAPGRVEFERHSKNTYQNATYSKRLAQPKPGERWLLVTSAFHMPRAMGAFRKAGFPVVAYPVDFRLKGDAQTWQLIPTASNGLSRVDVAVREYGGLIVYWFRGQTDALFPAP